MYDIEKLGKIIADIEKFFAELESFKLSEATLNDSKIVFASSMAMFGILNRTIDLGEEIIIKNSWGLPQAYKEYFGVLADNGIIGKDLAEELKKLAEDRNIFAHEYFNLNRKKVLDISKRIKAVKKLVERIKKLIKQEIENAKKK